MPRHTLGDLQHALMAAVWERGEASAAEVHEALRKARGLALTTIEPVSPDRLRRLRHGAVG